MICIPSHDIVRSFASRMQIHKPTLLWAQLMKRLSVCQTTGKAITPSCFFLARLLASRRGELYLCSFARSGKIRDEQSNVRCCSKHMNHFTLLTFSLQDKRLVYRCTGCTVDLPKWTVPHLRPGRHLEAATGNGGAMCSACLSDCFSFKVFSL